MALIIGPISIAFVATGIYSYSRSNEGDKALAEVGGSKITPEEFDQTKRQELIQFVPTHLCVIFLSDRNATPIPF